MRREMRLSCTSLANDLVDMLIIASFGDSNIVDYCKDVSIAL